MYKKRLDRGSCKKAQITIFIIVGILILFIFMFMIFLTGSFTKQKLSMEAEEVFTKAFKKEALRIYVQDCLDDGLKDGLRLLGSQGTLWLGQGGTQQFEQGVSGIEYDGVNIMYGIVRAKYKNGEENKYPCSPRDNSEGPQFCKYESSESSCFFPHTIPVQ